MLRYADDGYPNAAILSRSLETCVEDLAEEIFSLQVLGERKSYDELLTEHPLVYRSVRNGLVIPEGERTPAVPEQGVLSLVRSLFEHERHLGNDVIVWRVLPVWVKHAPAKLMFRCAFTTCRSIFNKHTPGEAT